MKLVVLLSSLLLSTSLHAEIKGYVAPKVSLGYSIQNHYSTIDGVNSADKYGTFTYGVGVSLVRRDIFATVKYQNADYTDIDHNYYIFNLGTTFATVSDKRLGFIMQISLGWDDYEWKRVPTPVNNYSSVYEGGSFAYGAGISFYYEPADNINIQIEYEAFETSDSKTKIAQTLENDPSGEIRFGFNSSFMLTVNYGFGIGRYEPRKKSKDIEQKSDDDTKETK